MARFIIIIQASLAFSCLHTLSACNEPKHITAPAKVQILKEQDPDTAAFLEKAIQESLQRIYTQHGCASMAQMKSCHGDDTCMFLYGCACLDALEQYWYEHNKLQAVVAAQYYNW